MKINLHDFINYPIIDNVDISKGKSIVENCKDLVDVYRVEITLKGYQFKWCRVFIADYVDLKSKQAQFNMIIRSLQIDVIMLSNNLSLISIGDN